MRERLLETTPHPPAGTLGWRIHCGVAVTESSTNKQLSSSPAGLPCTRLPASPPPPPPSSSPRRPLRQLPHLIPQISLLAFLGLPCPKILKSQYVVALYFYRTYTRH